MIPLLSRGAQSICPYWLFHVSSYSVHHGRFIRTCPCPYAFSLFISPIAHTVSSYGVLQQQYTDDTQFNVAISKDNYNTPVAKLELCLSTLHTWICYNGLALTPDKSEAIVFGTTSTHVLFQIPLLSMSPEPLSRFLIRSGFMVLPLTVNSHSMHTSLHFQNPVSITSAHSATSVPTSHWTVPRTLPVLLSAVASITPNRPSSGSRLRTFFRLQRLQTTLARIVTYQRGYISISKTLQELHWLSIKWRIDYKVATLTSKLREYGEPTYQIPYH